MLYSPNSRVISLLMWDTWNAGEVNKAAAVGTMLMAVTCVMILAGRLVDQRRSRRTRST